MDSWVSSGVDRLTLLKDWDMRIQLPCHSRNWNLQIPVITETLRQGHVLPFVPNHLRPSKPEDNMGSIAHFIRVVAIRRRVLRYVLLYAL